MNSLSDKIRNFLNDAGFEFAGDRSSNLELLRYFEKEYGIEMMRFMEEEWFQQQLNKETASGFMEEFRSQVDAERLEDFDRDLSSLRGWAA